MTTPSGIKLFFFYKINKAGLYNILPVGRMWFAKAFLAAGESFLNCRKYCKNSTSNK